MSMSIVLRCKDGYGLVDVGLATYDGALSLVKGLKALGIRLMEITKVYITHFHADHITLAQFLAEVASSQLLHRRTRTNGYRYLIKTCKNFTRNTRDMRRLRMWLRPF